MKKRIIMIMIGMIILVAGAGTAAFAATENLIIRVGYPQAGENQFVGTVRIYETDQTIDSIQEGDIFTIILENAEFMSPPSLVERGRFDLDIITGGGDGDTHVTYRFVNPVSPRTGQVIIDFVFDDMRVTGGDVSARIDSVQSGVTSGYFRLPGTAEPEKEETVTKESVSITAEQLQESIDKRVNIVVNHDDYQLVLPYGFLSDDQSDAIIDGGYLLKITVERDAPSANRHLSDVFNFIFEKVDSEEAVLETYKEFEKEAVLKILNPDINDRRNVRAALLDGTQEFLLATHYDQKNEQIIVYNSDFSKPLTLVRASNIREIVFNKDENFFIRNDQNYLPLRYIADQLQWQITWNPFERQVYLVNGEQETLVDQFIIIRERSFVTVDFVRQTFGVPVFELDDQIIIKKY